MNIEERHFVVVTGISNGTVTFKDSGNIVSKTVTEFQARWFGVALIQEGYDPSLLTVGTDHKLTTKDLLKVKGAGWFKKLFKKIVQVFKEVFQAIAKVVNKVIAAVTKALTTVFGKTVGGFLASLTLGPLKFIGNTAYYLGQGDIKGLFKYWGQMALQFVIQAVVAIVAPYLLGALAMILQGFLNVASAALGQLAGAFSGVISGALQQGAQFLSGLATKVGAFADKVFAKAGQFLRDLKANPFNAVKTVIKNSIMGVVNQLKPTAILSNFTKTFNGLSATSSISKFIQDSAVKFGLKIAESKIGESIENSKMGAFTKAFLSSVSSAGFQAVGSLYSQGTDEYFKQLADSLGVGEGRSPPVNKPGFLEKVKSIGSSLQKVLTGVLKNAAGGIQSLFIYGSGGRALPPEAKITFSPDGEVSYYQPLNSSEADIEYAIETLVDGTHRVTDDRGTITNTKLDATKTKIVSKEVVGNLDEGGSDFGDALLGAVLSGQRNGLLEFANEYVHSARDDFADYLANQISGWNPDVQGGIGYAYGLGEGFYDGAMGLALLASNPVGNGLTTGSLLARAAVNYKDTYQSIRSGVTQFFNTAAGSDRFAGGRVIGQPFGQLLFAIASGGATKAGFGTNSAQRARVLGNIADSQAARLGSRFGEAGVNVSSTGVKISSNNAIRLLVSRGLSMDRAKEFVSSFEGPLSIRRASPTEIFTRYSNFEKSQGSFLTKSYFYNTRDAVNELVLQPYGNKATFMQLVQSPKTPLIIEGQIRGSSTAQRQYLINQNDFLFSRGKRYYD
ncbi:MAG: hypothetical protein KBC91_01645 [Candidatus Omnitrophica bacterium]|nr:hypothetical protein [Candidatus Omnitrophota bacterium]